MCRDFDTKKNKEKEMRLKELKPECCPVPTSDAEIIIFNVLSELQLLLEIMDMQFHKWGLVEEYELDDYFLKIDKKKKKN